MVLLSGCILHGWSVSDEYWNEQEEVGRWGSDGEEEEVGGEEEEGGRERGSRESRMGPNRKGQAPSSSHLLLLFFLLSLTSTSSLPNTVLVSTLLYVYATYHAIVFVFCQATTLLFLC